MTNPTTSTALFVYLGRTYLLLVIIIRSRGAAPAPSRSPAPHTRPMGMMRYHYSIVGLCSYLAILLFTTTTTTTVQAFAPSSSSKNDGVLGTATYSPRTSLSTSTTANCRSRRLAMTPMHDIVDTTGNYYDMLGTSATSSSMITSEGVATLDPTSVLSDILGGLLGSYAILAVPIIAGLSVVAIIALVIVNYANPADEDD